MGRYLACVGLGFAIVHATHAQGILTVTPGRASTTIAGTGAVGYSGDGGAATSATLASPSAVAYDATGNLYIADANNHVIRRQGLDGTISTVAGTGIAGFSGDGGAATSAQLDTPTGIAVDSSGNLYIADTHNHRVRKVSGGTISTIAGTGVGGFGGDGGAAATALLNKPSAVAIDAGGNLYIADTNNQRIRRISGTTITTIAGNGEQGFSGDGSSALTASLDSPTGIAVSGNGILYIADRNNQRIRAVDASGIISTMAGSGSGSFAGGFSGDGASSITALLAKPFSVAVDSTGSIFFADTNNQRIRQIGNSGIITTAGSGPEGFGGDGSPSTSSLLDLPQGIALDATGNLGVADKGNQRIRLQTQGTLSFAAQAVGTTSTPQTVTLSNTGNATLTLSQLAVPTGFTRVAGGSCSAVPIALSASSSCTVAISYAPQTSGAATGTLTIGGTDIPVQKVLLVGSAATTSSTALSLTADNSTPLVGQQVNLSATITATAGVAASGSIVFAVNGTPIGTAPLSGGVATIATSFPANGVYTVSATYSGDGNYSPAVATLAETAKDFNFTVGTTGSSSGNGSDFTVTVLPGGVATYQLLFQPIGNFPYPIHLSVTGLPPGATATLSPTDFTPNGSPVQVTLKIQTATAIAMRQTLQGPLSLSVLILPFALSLRRRTQRLQGTFFVAALFGGAIIMGSLVGCGTGTGFFGQPVTSYKIVVVATAQGPNGATLQHNTNLTLTVQ